MKVGGAKRFLGHDRETGTVPQASQWTIGIGAPQARWRETGKSAARKRFAGRVTSVALEPRQTPP